MPALRCTSSIEKMSFAWYVLSKYYLYGIEARATKRENKMSVNYVVDLS